MPKDYCRSRTKARARAYTLQYHRLFAKSFKALIKASLGEYVINVDYLSKDHQKFVLIQNRNGVKIAVFNIQGRDHQIELRLDNRSASKKLYISCPYCQMQRQHLYVIESAYACRQCIGLSYKCQSERASDRLMRRIRKRRKALWGANWPEVNNMFVNHTYWNKPQGIHWRKFYRKVEEINQLEHLYWPMIKLKLDSTRGKNRWDD